MGASPGYANAPTRSGPDTGHLRVHGRTPAEVAAAVRPTDLSADLTPFADVRRYGVVGDGTTDDTRALESAFQVAGADGLALAIPYGMKVKITDYVQIRSNTALHIFGKLQLTDRRSGLFTNGAEYVGIYGHKIGKIEDSTVSTDYRWNASPNYAPAIHIRSGSHIVVDGLNFSHCCAGIQISNSAENWLPGVNWSLRQPVAADVKVQNCVTEFCEMSGLSLLTGINCGFYNNYIYRCGDGGLWMMGSQACDVIGNHRVSPKSVLADVVAHGLNNPHYPTTWNDEQGIEFQSSDDLLIADNVVENFYYGIDVKENCNRVVISRNRVRFCEQASIIVREGDAGNVGSCGKVSITGNLITSHGYGLLSSRPVHSTAAAISVSSGYFAEIADNVICSYRLTPGIVCLGPGPWQTSQYPRNPQQASLTVTGNTVDFTAMMAGDPTEFTFDAATLGAIQIQGAYTSVKCDGNHIRTDRYYYSDVRMNPRPAISLAYLTNGPAYFYPTSASISNNEIVGWGNTGIAVVGLASMETSGLAVNGNVVSGAGGTAIFLDSTHYALCSGNNIAQNNSTSTTAYGILLQGSTAALSGVVCSGNSISGGNASRGGNALTHGIAVRNGKEINCTNNSITGCMAGPFLVEHPTGNVFTQGCSTFPRAGEPPNGKVIAYHRGEMYFDTTNAKWWVAGTFASTAWAQLST